MHVYQGVRDAEEARQRTHAAPGSARDNYTGITIQKKRNNIIFVEGPDGYM